MRIVCPHCAAAYEVAPELLAGRRAVRCARCQQSWELAAPPEHESEPPPPEPAPPPVPPSRPPPDAEPKVTVTPPVRERPVADEPRPAPPSLALRLGWAASLLVVAAALGSAVAWRGDIMHAWPPSTRLYAALHLTQ